jgi:hypothetical protein
VQPSYRDYDRPHSKERLGRFYPRRDYGYGYPRLPRPEPYGYPGAYLGGYSAYGYQSGYRPYPRNYGYPGVFR